MTADVRRLRCVALASALLLAPLVAAPLAATSFVRVADADLARQADLIVEARVRDAAFAERRAGMPMTDYQVEVMRVVAGPAAVGDTLAVRVHGGRDAEGMSFQVHGAPRFGRNEPVLLLLRRADDGTWRVLHVLQGLFRIGETFEGQRVAYRNFAEAQEVSTDRELTPEGFRDLDRFASWLGRRAGGEEAAADYALGADVQLMENAVERFTLMIASNGRPLRWEDFGNGLLWYAHQGGQPGLAGGGFGQFQGALSVWTDEPFSNVRYLYAGTNNATGGLQNGEHDDTNTIVFDNVGNAGEFDEPFDCDSGGTLAVGGPWYSTQFQHQHNGTTYVTIQEADIVTNSGLACWITSSSAEEVFTHELGHTLGLDHSCETQSQCNASPVKNEAIMRAYAHGDGRGGRLNSDDLEGLYTLYGTGVGPTVPAAPTGLDATPAGSGRIDLHWNDNSNNEEGFRIERRTGAGGYAQIATTAANVRDYADTTVVSGTTYTYRVRASNGAGTSSYSNEDTAATGGERAPSGLNGVALTPTSVRLNYFDNSSGEAGFEVEAQLLGGFHKVASVGPGVTQVVVSGLVSDVVYNFRVRAIGGVGASTYSNTAVVTMPLAPIAPCQESATVTCLNDNRFKVEVRWRTVDSQGSGTVAPLGSADSGLFYFFSANNWELLVKVLDGCGINSRFWVFAAATTAVEYTLVVTDTRTGQTSVKFNPLNVSAAAITDTDAFATCGASAQGQAQTAASSVLPEVSASPASWPLPMVAEPAAAVSANCVPSATVLCLNQGRFKAELVWQDFVGQIGNGQSVLGTGDSGLMWFFSDNNWEILIKVLDGCALNDRYWVFAAATTNVAYALKVTDTSNGAVRTYNNSLGVSSPAITDTGAFATCP